MLRKFLISSASGLAMLVMTADTARADPISASIVAAIGLSGVAATVATSAITAAISIGLSYAANALFAPPKPPGGAILEVQAGGALPRQVPFGTVASAGHLVYWNSYGKKNKFLQRVYRLADWECSGLLAVWVDGKRVSLTAVTIPGGNNEAARYHVDGYGNKFVVRWFAGSSTQLADTELVDNANPTGRWTTDHRGRGICYVSITLTFDDDLFPGGLPQLLFEFRGAKLYDLRQDSTAGGSGSQRWFDPTTWAYSENPAVCAYNFLRGFFRSGQLVHGWGLPDLALSLTDLVASMNLCDEAITEGGSSVPRYRCSVITNEGNELRQGLQAFVDAMGGYFYEAGGVVHVKGGGAEAAVATLTSDDLVIDAEAEYTSKRPRAEMVNRISGTFTDPVNAWQPVDYPEISSPSWLAEDNGEDLGLDYNLPSVTSGYQAERIALIRANMARLQKRVKIEVLEKHIFINAGDWIVYAADKVGGSVTWLVRSVEELPDRGTLRFELEEVSAAAFGGAFLFDPIILTPPSIDTGATTVAGFTATGTSIDDGDGEIPILLLEWTPPDDPTITGVKFEYYVDAVGAKIQRALMREPEAGIFTLSDGIVQNTTYKVRATVETTPIRATTFTSLQTTTTPVITPATVQVARRSVYTADGTWTKASNPANDPVNATVVIEAWGGGGGGGRGGVEAAGGGGGAYSRREVSYADLPASLDVTVGAGGAGRASSTGSGSNGTSSIVSQTGGSTVYVTAYHGGGGEGSNSTGNVTLGGGGGGALSAGQAGTAGGAGGAIGGGSNPAENNFSVPSVDGGAAGNISVGGAAYNGGGGGGGGSDSFGALYPGGSSRHGGSGGSGGYLSTPSGAGVAPGGGGGGGWDTDGANGARGEVRITLIG